MVIEPAGSDVCGGDVEGGVHGFDRVEASTRRGTCPAWQQSGVGEAERRAPSCSGAEGALARRRRSSIEVMGRAQEDR